MSVRERFEAQATAWHDEGRTPRGVMLPTFHLLAVYCWLVSEGARWEDQQKPISKRLHTFIRRAREARSPDWYDNLMADRSECHLFHERYTAMANLFICTNCHYLYCFDCFEGFTEGSNGNRRCPRCVINWLSGNGEVVRMNVYPKRFRTVG